MGSEEGREQIKTKQKKLESSMTHKDGLEPMLVSHFLHDSNLHKGSVLLKELVL